MPIRILFFVSYLESTQFHEGELRHISTIITHFYGVLWPFLALKQGHLWFAYLMQ